MAENRNYGYIRVSSKDQNLDRQRESIRQYVADDHDIYEDKASGKDMDREGYKALKHTLRTGDTLYIHSLDRLGRNKTAVKNELQELTQKGIVLRILDIPTSMIDYHQFGTLQKSIMEMVNNILVEVLSTIAENERTNIKKRQMEGIEAAKKKKVKFGRPVREFPVGWAEDYLKWKAKEITAVLFMKKYNMASSTFYKKVGEWEAKKNAVDDNVRTTGAYITRGRMRHE